MRYINRVAAKSLVNEIEFRLGYTGDDTTENFVTSIAFAKVLIRYLQDAVEVVEKSSGITYESYDSIYDKCVEYLNNKKSK